MCVLVTISEKRGIVYTEHMPVAEAAVAAVAAVMEAKRGLEVGGLSEHADAVQSRCRFSVCILGTCKSSHVKIQTPSKEGRGDESGRGEKK